jgi:hypothetical protein
MNTGTATTPDVLMKRLYAPFPAPDHEWHAYFGFVYLKEEAINTRLTCVLGPLGWDKFVTEYHYIPAGEPVIEIKSGNAKAHLLLSAHPGEIVSQGEQYYAVARDEHGEIADRKELKVVYDIPVVMARGYMTVRCGEASATRWSIGGDVLTDLGKERGARLLNTYKAADTDLLKRLARQFGVGLYLTEAKGVTKDTLAQWLRDNYGPTTVKEAKQMLVAALKDQYTDPKTLGEKIRSAGYTDEDLVLDYSRILNELREAT